MVGSNVFCHYNKSTACNYMMVSQSKATYVYLIIAYHIYDDGIFAGLTACR